MDLLGSSECSSGCESGWTLYLDHSVSSTNPTSNYREIHGYREKTAKEKSVYDEEEEEEDLSMVSDASSGPPHFNEDETGGYGQDKHYSVSSCREETAFNSNAFGKKQGKREKNRGREDRKTASFVDDTASSPFFNFSNSNFSVNNINQASLGSPLDYSQGFSATHFQGGPAFQDEFGLFQSPLSGHQMQNNQSF